MPSTGSINFTDVASFRSYVETYREDLTIQAFTDFEGADYAIGIEGVKGKQVLPKLTVGAMSKRWARAFNPTEDTLKFGYDIIETVKAKVELVIYPQDFEGNHIMGRKRAKGQGMDIPAEQVMMNQVFAKVQAEISDAFWNAVAAGSPASTDTLDMLFNGQTSIFLAMATAGTIENVPVPGGAYTVNNILKHFSDMRLAQGAAYRKMPTNVYLTSPEVGAIYYDAVQTKQNGGQPLVRYVNGVRQIRTYDNTGWVAEIADLSGTSFVALMETNRMFYAFDAFSDVNGFNILEVVRGFDFWMDYMFGVQLVVPEKSAVVYNLL